MQYNGQELLEVIVTQFSHDHTPHVLWLRMHSLHTRQLQACESIFSHYSAYDDDNVLDDNKWQFFFMM